VTTLLSRAAAAKMLATGFTPFYAGGTARGVSHVALNGCEAPQFTFYGARISHCFRMARARVVGGDAITLGNLANLVLQGSVAECVYKVRGITFKVLQRGGLAGRPCELQIQGIDFARNPRVGFGVGRLQYPVRRAWDEEGDRPLDPCVTFHAETSSECFQRAFERCPGERIERTLFDLAYLVGLDQEVRRVGDSSPIECLHEEGGIIYRVGQRGGEWMLQIEGADIDGVLLEREAQNDSLQKSWPAMRWVILDVNPGLEGVPGKDALAGTIRPWMHANRSLLQGISNLSLNQRNLTCVPTEVGYFTGLRGLFLSGNQLKVVPHDLSCWFPRLQRLYLDENLLTSVPATLLDGLTDLQWLNLSHNRLRCIPNGLFSNQSNLRSLDLGYNCLHFIRPGQFRGLVSLESLNLRDNLLGSLPRGLLVDLPKLVKLELNGNPLGWLPVRNSPEE
jgi:hypothetical protein